MKKKYFLEQMQHVINISFLQYVISLNQYICCAPLWNLPRFKTVLHRFGIPKWGAHFETVLHHFGTPSLAPFQNGAAPFWNIYFFNLN